MSKTKQLFNAKQFGLEGKALALVDLDKLLSLMVFLKHQASPEFYKILKTQHQFTIVPVVTELHGLKGGKAAIVDYDNALKAIQYIQENVDPTILSVLKTEYQFDFYPVLIQRKRTFHQIMYIIGCHVLKWSLAALVAVKLFL